MLGGCASRPGVLRCCAVGHRGGVAARAGGSVPARARACSRASPPGSRPAQTAPAATPGCPCSCRWRAAARPPAAVRPPSAAPWPGAPASTPGRGAAAGAAGLCAQLQLLQLETLERGGWGGRWRGGAAPAACQRAQARRVGVGEMHGMQQWHAGGPPSLCRRRRQRQAAAPPAARGSLCPLPLPPVALSARPVSCLVLQRPENARAGVRNAARGAEEAGVRGGGSAQPLAECRSRRVRRGRGPSGSSDSTVDIAEHSRQGLGRRRHPHSTTRTVPLHPRPSPGFSTTSGQLGEWAAPRSPPDPP